MVFYFYFYHEPASRTGGFNKALTNAIMIECVNALIKDKCTRFSFNKTLQKVPDTNVRFGDYFICHLTDETKS